MKKTLKGLPLNLQLFAEEVPAEQPEVEVEETEVAETEETEEKPDRKSVV